jgi:hypothetical protein
MNAKLIGVGGAKSFCTISVFVARRQTRRCCRDACERKILATHLDGIERLDNI